MSVHASYAFVLDTETYWKLSTEDDWKWEIVELDGTEKVMGHYRIDGATYKVVSTATGKTVAITK
jgi:hypothetical protein